LEATLELAPKQHLRVYGVHLVARPLVLLEMWRWWEIKTALHRIRPHMAKPCLLAGDFNAIGPGDPVNVGEWPHHLKRMLTWYGGRVPRWVVSEVKAAGFVDCFRSLHPHEDGFTLPTPLPNSRLDYILANEALTSRLIECRVVREPLAVEQASDHYPVVAEFA
jgi:exonuclease III